MVAVNESPISLGQRDSSEAALTVVILTYNEAQNIERCLRGVPDQYSVLVVDSGSTDGTTDIAKRLGARVVVNPWGGFVAQRNFALEECRIESEWILFVDADEIFEDKFFAWFEEIRTKVVEVDAFMVPQTMVVGERQLRYAPGYPVFHPRLVKRGRVSFVPNHTGHGETLASECRVGFARLGYIHYFVSGGIEEWFTKQIARARLESIPEKPKSGVVTARARISLLLGRSFWRIPARFIYHYFIRLGFMDGRLGLQYALMFAWFEMTKYVFSLFKDDHPGSGSASGKTGTY